jgi:cytochrome b
MMRNAAGPGPVPIAPSAYLAVMLRRIDSNKGASGGCVPVWDLGVRACHWGLAAAVAACAVTGFVLGRTTLAWHLTAGAVVIALVAWRVVWGLLGPTYARFSSFVFPPARLLAHARGAFARQRQRHLGHNPLGAAMVFALLGMLAAIVVTGTVVLGGLLKQGPLRAFLAFDTGQQWLGVHNWLAIVLLVLIGLHVAGVVFESWRGRENLTAAMLSGAKPVQPPYQPVAPARARPRLALAIALGGLAAGAFGIAALASLPGRGVPPPDPDPVVAEQCGACHLAFPASLAPAATWDAIMADLQHHFGADASLSPEQVSDIRGWLDANAARHWDTLPSHRLRQPAADGSLRITDTPGWRRLHRDIADAVFTAKPIYRRSNCAACHADAATGRFAPQRIAIPETSP